MRKWLLLFIVAILLISFIPSCNLEMVDDSTSVNQYIFPYVKFTLSEDETYYSASILPGASVDSVYIPSYVDDQKDGELPVRYFTGFENSEDIVNLKSTEFESSITEIKLDTSNLNPLDQAKILSTITYDEVSQTNTTWQNLPDLVHTEDEEFLGWFLTNNSDVQIHNGDVMIDGYTSIFAKWGIHNFKEVEGKNPTCTDVGWNSYHYCTNSGCNYTTKVEIAALGHSLIKHEKANPTCINVGYSQDCWECTRCNLFFADSEGETEIDKEKVIIPVSGHSSDCTIYKDDSDHWLKCAVCGDEYNKVAHTYGNWHASQEKGYQERECSYCHHVQKAEETHSWEEVASTESTCTTHGHTGYWICTAHQDEYSISNNPISIINEATLHEMTDLPLKDHSLGAWQHSDTEHWKVCSVCKGKFEIASHEFEYTFSVQAERNLVVERKCIICGTEGKTESKGNSAFDISTAFGPISIINNGNNRWTLSYTGNCSSCYWANESGDEIISGTEAFSITYVAEGEGSFKVFCYAFDSNKNLISISFALLTGN